MKEDERRLTAEKFYDKMENFVVSLYGRWQDEKDYEDINDYGTLIKKEVDKIGGKFIKMVKKPFGFLYSLDDVTYQISISNKNYTYKRVVTKVK
jgi:hypothetical protein